MVIIPVIVPSNEYERQRGLLDYDHPPQGHGMLFVDAPVIHTIGMKFPILVVFFDHKWKVIDVLTAYPNQSRVTTPGARHVLELSVDYPDVIKLGQTYKLNAFQHSFFALHSC